MIFSEETNFCYKKAIINYFMSDYALENNKRIAKNTLFLYLRMFLMMAISLFTSRIILSILGVSDYGIYNVVGGVVAMFGLLSGSITNSITRFLTFELGKKDYFQLQKVFSTSLNVMMVLSLVIVVIGEVVGIWFLNYKMNIPEGRMDAANWAFQCSLITFVMNLISIPYNSTIVAHEKMSAFAYISIFEVIMKLLIVYSLYISPFDKLKSYVVLLLILSFVIRFIYGFYCKRHFKEATYHFIYDKGLLKNMTSFAGWNFFGQGAYMMNNQGVNIIVNIFFGVTINAARGIASQVNSAVNQFVTNFMMALNPQITKCYATGKYEDMHKLVFRGSKFSYFLMLFFLIPICLETEMILRLWLNVVPKYTVAFVRWTLIITAMGMLSNTLITALHASGHIKKYMIIVGIVEVLNFPLTYVVFQLGANPLSAYYVYFFVYFVLMFLRLYLVKDLIKMKASRFLKEVYLKIILVTSVSLILPLIVRFFKNDSLTRFVEISVISMISVTFSIYFLGLTKDERNRINQIITKRFKQVYND